MPLKITVPRLTDTELKGTIGKWYKKEGEEVEEGEPIFELETMKAVEDVKSPASGKLWKVLVSEGSEVSVSETVGIICEPDDTMEELNDFMKTIDVLPETTDVNRKPMPTGAREERIKASPAAKRLAQEHGKELTSIKATGPGGIITKEDVLKTVEQSDGKETKAEIIEVIPMTGIRKNVAEQVTKGYENPQVTITTEADVTEILGIYQRLKLQFEKEKALKLTFLPLLIKAVAVSLGYYPILNSALENGEIKVFKSVNISVAVSTEAGLAVPVVHEAQTRTLVDIVSSLQDLGQKAKTGRLSLEDVTGGTFTVSNLGAFGVTVFTPILNYPQCAVLGVGQLADKVVAIEGKIEVRKLLILSLTFDHRIVDGVPAAQFLRKLKEILETPSVLQITLET